MANGCQLTLDRKKGILYRAYTATPSSTLYTVPSQFHVGINQTDLVATTTSLTMAVPIGIGTPNDSGANTLTGSLGAANSTANTTTYKEGAGLVDNTAQNLVATSTSSSPIKAWTLHPLTTGLLDYTKPVGLWIYILDAAALAKLKSSGTCLEVRLGSDASNYYYFTKTASQLSIGWNWITPGPTTAVSTLLTVGTATSPKDYFATLITCNNTSDTFAAGDVVYDLLRQWATTDLSKTFMTGSPVLDYNNLTAQIRGALSSVEANGFLINSFLSLNTDTAPQGCDVAKFTGESKSGTDEFRITINTREI